jgi:hypothetical protein
MKKQFILSFACLLLFVSMAAAQAVPNEESVAQSPTTAITFDESEFNFGKVAVGEKVQHIYRFTNTGDEPLVLSNAKGSCGCTVPTWPKDPIQPGGSGAIVVEFDTKGKMGPQVKQVTITANTDPTHTNVYIKGEVFGAQSSEPLLNPALKIQNVEAVSLAKTDDILVYPNPASSFLTVELKDATGKTANMEVFNGNGQLVDKLNVAEVGKSNLQFDVRNYEVGTYWLSVKIGDADRVSLPFVVAR